MTANAELDALVLAWIASARRRRTGNAAVSLLWFIADHVAGVREIPEAWREKCGELLESMKQTPEVRRVKEACGYGS